MELAIKVEKNQLSEREYRGLKERLSYSSLKSFDADRAKFYYEYIEGHKTRDTDSVATLVGDMVHTILAGQDLLDKFHILAIKEPVGQMKDLANALFKYTLIESPNEDEPLQNFDKIFINAVDSVKYDASRKEIAFKGKTLDVILDMYKNSEAELYYKELLDNRKKKLVSMSLIEKAENIAKKLYAHPYTKEYASINSEKNIDVFTELTVLFEVKELPYKSMLDKVIVNHENKTIQPLDWKTSWDNEDPQKAYLKLGYYIQAGLYNYALHQWAKEHDLGDYEILPMIYIFCDTTGFADPVLLKLTKADIDATWKGFTVRGYRYRGIAELINDIAWHIENRIWSTSYEMYLNKGVVKLHIDYDTSN
jgi:hypothetical protein